MKRWIAVLLTLALMLAMAGTAGGEEKKTFVMAGYDGSNVGRVWAESEFFKRMAEPKRTGVSFTFKQYADLNTYRNWVSALSSGSGDLPDVLFKAMLTDEDARTLYNRGVLIDIMPYINEETMPNLWGILREHPEYMTEMTLDGAVITLPVIDELQVNNAIWINTAWLKQLNLDMPTTAEELTAVLRAFKANDPNMNGRSDEIPMTFTGLWDLCFLQHAFGLNMDDYYLTADEAGRVTSPVTSAENRAFLEWLHTLWDEGLIDHAGFSSPDTLRKITDEKAAIKYGVVFGPSPDNMLPRTATGDYSVLMPLTYHGTQTYRSLLGPINRGCFAVTSACADPEAVLRWVDYLYSEVGCFLARVGLEGTDYKFDESGYWKWVYGTDALNQKIIAPATIDGGGLVPGYVTPDYWLKYDDEAILREKGELAALAEIAAEPCPQVMLTGDEASRLATLWLPVSMYCENQMVQFVTGDVPLNDETWQAFCEKTAELGMDQVVEIWQGALNREGGVQ